MDNVILLDLDGVLILHPPWKNQEVLEDDFAKFDKDSVSRLNQLIRETGYDIVLSSSRRLHIDIDQMNEYFNRRGVIKPIKSYVPNYNPVNGPWLTRVIEVERFIEELDIKNYLIIDDDKSLHDLKDKSKWIQTYMSIGFKR